MGHPHKHLRGDGQPASSAPHGGRTGRAGRHPRVPPVPHGDARDAAEQSGPAARHARGYGGTAGRRARKPSGVGEKRGDATRECDAQETRPAGMGGVRLLHPRRRKQHSPRRGAGQEGAVENERSLAHAAQVVQVRRSHFDVRATVTL